MAVGDHRCPGWRGSGWRDRPGATVSYRRILAIDPGKEAGWCLFCDGFCHSSGGADGESVAEVRRIYEHAVPEIVVIEDQHFNPRVSPYAIKTLVERAALWYWLAIDRGIDVAERVPALAWQDWAGIPRQKRKPKTSDKTARKQLINLRASEVAGTTTMDNESDAVLLCSYWFNAVLPVVEENEST
uniref:Holliday junction resolvase RuvC n=1 Tax=viral metagenome TaxID=1070528 RepID=A0A6M3XDL1_9ZZZZ